jgi:hypothetical protein
MSIETTINQSNRHILVDIVRRAVDVHEREYLKSQRVVTDTQCNLGLTALKLDDVLKLMSIDYPEKCHVSYRRCMNH